MWARISVVFKSCNNFCFIIMIIGYLGLSHALKVVSDQAITTRKWPLMRPSSDPSDLLSYIERSNQIPLTVFCYTVCLGLRSDQRTLPSGTSTWGIRYLTTNLGYGAIMGKTRLSSYTLSWELTRINNIWLSFYWLKNLPKWNVFDEIVNSTIEQKKENFETKRHFRIYFIREIFQQLPRKGFGWCQFHFPTTHIR